MLDAPSGVMWKMLVFVCSTAPRLGLCVESTVYIGITFLSFGIVSLYQFAQ